MSKIEQVAKTINPGEINNFISNIGSLRDDLITMRDNSPVEDHPLKVAGLFLKYGIA